MCSNLPYYHIFAFDEAWMPFPWCLVSIVLDVENVSVQFFMASKVCIEASFGVWQWHNWLDMLPTICLIIIGWYMSLYITNITNISHSWFLTLDPRFSCLKTQTSLLLWCKNVISRIDWKLFACCSCCVKFCANMLHLVQGFPISA